MLIVFRRSQSILKNLREQNPKINPPDLLTQTDYDTAICQGSTEERTAPGAIDKVRVVHVDYKSMQTWRDPIRRKGH